MSLSAGVAHYQPTPNAATPNTRNRRRWGRPRWGNKRPGQESLKFRNLVVILRFLRSVAFRGVLGEGHPRDFLRASQIQAIDVIDRRPNAKERQHPRPRGIKICKRTVSDPIRTLFHQPRPAAPPVPPPWQGPIGAIWIKQGKYERVKRSPRDIQNVDFSRETPHFWQKRADPMQKKNNKTKYTSLPPHQLWSQNLAFITEIRWPNLVKSPKSCQALWSLVRPSQIWPNISKSRHISSYLAKSCRIFPNPVKSLRI